MISSQGDSSDEYCKANVYIAARIISTNFLKIIKSNILFEEEVQ